MFANCLFATANRGTQADAFEAVTAKRKLADTALQVRPVGNCPQGRKQAEKEDRFSSVSD